MKTTRIALALAGLTLITACGTVQGVASDAWGAGKFVARQITND